MGCNFTPLKRTQSCKFQEEFIASKVNGYLLTPDHFIRTVAGLCLVLKLANGDTNIYKSFSTEDDSQSVLISDCLNFEKAPVSIRHGGISSVGVACLSHVCITTTFNFNSKTSLAATELCCETMKTLSLMMR